MSIIASHITREAVLKEAMEWASKENIIIMIGKKSGPGPSSSGGWRAWPYREYYPDDTDVSTHRYILPGNVITRLS